ncbi:putative RNA-binding protein YlmH [Gottschalkia purinilytica]|uniref:Putative RNA-binding protein YlmH n=1 Tax=Gottschalkia purinilytica TaxID=1503 RepID=A0A0L0WB46_GOTPU|nr:YlmH/Sll1252 family protein [Gottschalkia purinilytica]KNF08723.1 putative RNA-binding protein YlmH [Gottschalkia purinilytica]
MIIDKVKYIEHIQDKTQHLPMRKIVDKVERVLKYHEVECTDFLDPYQVRLSHSILNRFDVNFYEEGGINSAERKSLVIFPEYMTKDTIEIPIKALKISGNFKFTDLTHRDYLGAILGLGIKREKVGDILIHEDFSQVIVHEDLVDYILYNLKYIGKEPVKIDEIKLDSVIEINQEYKEINITIASPRLDAFISEVCNLSRSKSLLAITQGKVKVNWQPITNSSYKVGEGDTISIRGFGRIKIAKDLGITKKGRDKMTIRILK